jgi:hypothetical protein
MRHTTHPRTFAFPTLTPTGWTALLVTLLGFFLLGLVQGLLLSFGVY